MGAEEHDAVAAIALQSWDRVAVDSLAGDTSDIR